jgi:hypothetical protein
MYIAFLLASLLAYATRCSSDGMAMKTMSTLAADIELQIFLILPNYLQMCQEIQQFPGKPPAERKMSNQKLIQMTAIIPGRDLYSKATLAK